jgi:hypothetical protein
MKKIEELKNELQQYQKDYIKISAERRFLKKIILSTLKNIDNLEPKSVFFNIHAKLIYRDVDLCVDFIRENSSVTSTQLITYLNTILTDLEKRWPEDKPLDGNYFMARVGNKLKLDSRIRYEKNGIGMAGKKTTIWEIKI